MPGPKENRIRFDLEKKIRSCTGSGTQMAGIDIEIETLPVPGGEEVCVNIIPVHIARYQYRRDGLFSIPVEAMDELAKWWAFKRGLFSLNKEEYDAWLEAQG